MTIAIDFPETAPIDRSGLGHTSSGPARIDLPAVTGPTPRRGIAFVRLHDELWRVTRSDGEILGYVESFPDPRGRRYRAKRLIPLQKRFLVLGEFWGFDDAVDCLRFG